MTLDYESPQRLREWGSTLGLTTNISSTVTALRRPTRVRPVMDPTGGAAAAQWQVTTDTPLYPRIHIERDIPIRMDDGVVLSAYVLRPADEDGQPITTPIPTIVNLTPYNAQLINAVDVAINGPGIGERMRKISKRLDFGGTPAEGVTEMTKVIAGGGADLFGVTRSLIQGGYAQVIVDVRGTGSSTGRWNILGAREQTDSLQVLQWIGEQPWSDGTYGLSGISYSAISALQAAGKRPPGLKAVFAVEGSEDIVRDIFATGGVPSLFIVGWLFTVNSLKWLPSVRALRSTKWITDRLRSPVTDVPSMLRGLATGNDLRIYDDPFFDRIAPIIEDIEVPTFVYGTWHDIFARSAPRIYRRLAMTPGRKQLMMTDGYHGNPGAGLGEPGTPPRLDVLARAWFDKWLRDDDNHVDEYGPVTMLRQNGEWASEPTFPSPAATVSRLYLRGEKSYSAPHSRTDGSLGPTPPRFASRHGLRSTIRGFRSRQTTTVTGGMTATLGPAFTTDARIDERRALSFSTSPMTSDVVISGPMDLHLWVSSIGRDALWTVTINVVAPDGTSTVLSDGALLESRRAIDDERSQFTPTGDYLVPHHPLTKKELCPVSPGEPMALEIDITATEARIPVGHRLRVDIYAGSFPRYLPIGPDLWKFLGRGQFVELDPRRPSFLSIPTLGELTP